MEGLFLLRKENINLTFISYFKSFTMYSNQSLYSSYASKTIFAKNDYKEFRGFRLKHHLMKDLNYDFLEMWKLPILI